MTTDIPRQFRFKEVIKHNHRSSPWLLIHDQVYDCTNFLDKHPGGEDILMAETGIDATDIFEETGHSTHARTLLKDLYIGDLVEEERKPRGAKGVKSADNLVAKNVVNYVIPAGIAFAGALVYTVMMAPGNAL